MFAPKSKFLNPITFRMAKTRVLAVLSAIGLRNTSNSTSSISVEILANISENHSR